MSRCVLALTVLVATLTGALPARAVVTGATSRERFTGSDIMISMTASAGFTAGGSATYTLTVRNNGPQAATGLITVVDTLPAGLSYTSAAGSGWTCSNSGQVVTCTANGPVLNKAQLPDITLVAAITNSVATSVTNVATVTNSGGNDTNLANNIASVTSPVAVRRVATTPDGAAVSQLPSNGTQYSVVFTVTNTGSVTDTYALAASVAPAGIVSIVSVNGVNGTTGSTGVLAPGASSTVTVVYTVATGAATGASAKLTMTATSALLSPADPGDLTVTVKRADITISKQLYRDDRTTLVTGGAGVQPGEYVQYKITVSSTGGAAANSVSVSDALPAAVTYSSAAGDTVGWTITNSSGTVTANLSGALTAGTSRYFWVRVQVK